MHNRANATDPDDDARVSDVDRFLHDRRVEALAMIRLWRKSGKPYAGDEERYWRNVLADIDRKAGHTPISD